MSRFWNFGDGKARWFVGTNYDIETDYDEVLKRVPELRFIAYGLEECPQTGQKHHQMYMYRANAINPTVKVKNKMGEWFGNKHVHIEAMMGRITDNESYCSKENELVKHGKEPVQGARGDLEETRDILLAGTMSVDEICVENPGFFHQYGRTMDRLETIALRRRFRTERTRGFWYHGPTGGGKSRACFAGFDPRTHYVKDLTCEWWDGYKGQEIVIFNEFRGQIPFAEMLDLMDEWPTTVKWRGKESVPFLAREIRISCVKPPEEVYNPDEDWGQWSRRCESVFVPSRKRSAQKMEQK